MRTLILTAVLLIGSPACDGGGGSSPAEDSAPAADTPALVDSAPAADTPASTDTGAVEDGLAPQDTPPAMDTPATTFPVEIGDKVPGFSLPASGGKTFNLADYKGQKILISSFPAATTAVCTIQTCYVSDHYEEFLAKNVFPVGLSSDPLEKLDAWAEAEHYKQLLLSDTTPKGEISQMLGIWDALGVTRRANLILDENRVLVWKRVYAMGETPNFEEVHAFLDGTD